LIRKVEGQAFSSPLEQYERLLEDLHDLTVVAERREEEPISLEELKQRLKKDGFILGCPSSVGAEYL